MLLDSCSSCTNIDILPYWFLFFSDNPLFSPTSHPFLHNYLRVIYCLVKLTLPELRQEAAVLFRALTNLNRLHEDHIPSPTSSAQELEPPKHMES